MRRLVPLVCLTVLSFLPGPAGAEVPAGEDYGAGLSLDRVTPLGDVLASPDRYANETVLVEGRVVDVCQKKGCWTVLREGEVQVRVRFEDYGFFLPRDSMGDRAFVEGVVRVEVLSEKEARHYAAESRQGDPARVVGPQREVGFVASGVRLVARGR